MMCRKLICSVCFILAIGLTARVASAGVSFADPLGGWTYIYTGDAAAPGDPDGTQGYNALDGTWSHENGSDEWDGSIIGQGAPGGAMVLTEGNTTFLRMQDTGDPRDHGMPDPSNRKIFFGHSVTNDIGATVANTIMDTGVTLSFRARIATTPPLDRVHPDGGGAITAWPVGGDGYVIHDAGKGFGIRQPTGDKTISFHLVLAGDPQGEPKIAGRTGLCMNNLNGTAVSGTVDIQGNEAGTLNLLDIADPTVWHEFWITIQADTTGQGTHKVIIYMDGNVANPSVFYVTAGDGNDYDDSYIIIEVGATPQSGAIDVDFFAYKPGLIPPVPANPNLARAVNPLPGTTVGVDEATPLSWLTGQSAKFHDVYFGTDKADVNDADISDKTGIYRGRQGAAIYSPPQALELGMTYYWRIDEVEADLITIHKGDVWGFMVTPYLLVDDFEDYNDFKPDRVFDTWADGYSAADPANGSIVGHLEPPFAERIIVHSGSQAMPFVYDNSGTAKLSEAVAKIDGLKSGRDWTAHAVMALSLWFRGYPAYFGSFVEAPAGTYTMTAGGADIWGTSDGFHFAFKEVSGAISIVAKVLSVSNTHAWAKAGVMIRDSLDPNSTHAMVVVTPSSGVAMQYRSTTAGVSQTVTQAGVVAPQWVKIERTLGGLVRGYYSADGTTWTQLGSGIATITMNTPMYVGLALTSHNVDEKCVAQFSNVSFPGTTVGLQWTDQDIGITSNKAEPMYVAISSGNGKTGVVYHEDPNATLISTWTEWSVDLKQFTNQGVVLTDVDKMLIGFGNKANPKSGGTGTMYFDDISLYPPRCILDKVTGLEADFTDDCVVNAADLEIMAQEWLKADYTVATAAPKDANLVLYYKFENNAVDSSGKGINGIPTGSPSYASGVFGQAISLNGSNYINCGNPALLNFGLGDWSICAWIKTTMSGTGDINVGTIFANGGDWGGGIRYTLAVGEANAEGAVVLTTDDDVTKLQAIGTSGLVNDNEWHHAVGLRNGNSLRVYVDGLLDATNDTVPVGYDLSGASQHNAYVGAITDHRDATGGTLAKFYTGLIDEVRIYDYALSEAEVAYLGTKGASGIYFPLVSIANLYDQEPQNQKKVNFKDYAVLADQWLKQALWP